MKKFMLSEKLSRPTCLSFATHFWVATHSLGNTALKSSQNFVQFKTMVKFLLMSKLTTMSYGSNW